MRPIDPHKAATARQMFWGKRSYAEIAAAVGVSLSSLKRMFRDHGLVRAQSVEVTGPPDETGIGFALGPDELRRLAEVRKWQVRAGERTLAEIGEL